MSFTPRSSAIELPTDELASLIDELLSFCRLGQDHERRSVSRRHVTRADALASCVPRLWSACRSASRARTARGLPPLPWLRPRLARGACQIERRRPGLGRSLPVNPRRRATNSAEPSGAHSKCRPSRKPRRSDMVRASSYGMISASANISARAVLKWAGRSTSPMGRLYEGTQQEGRFSFWTTFGPHDSEGAGVGRECWPECPSYV